MYYFPLFATEIVRRAPEYNASSELVVSIETLMKSLLSYYINSDKTVYDTVRADLQNVTNLLPAAPAELRPRMLEMMKHASIVLWHKREIDGLLRQITSAESAAVADSLFHVYQIDHRNAEESREVLSRRPLHGHLGRDLLRHFPVYRMVPESLASPVLAGAAGDRARALIAQAAPPTGAYSGRKYTIRTTRRGLS